MRLGIPADANNLPSIIACCKTLFNVLERLIPNREVWMEDGEFRCFRKIGPRLVDATCLLQGIQCGVSILSGSPPLPRIRRDLGIFAKVLGKDTGFGTDIVIRLQHDFSGALQSESIFRLVSKATAPESSVVGSLPLR